MVFDNKCPENVENLRVKYYLEGGLKRAREEKDVAVAHNNNRNRQYDNV